MNENFYNFFSNLFKKSSDENQPGNTFAETHEEEEGEEVGF